MMSSEPPSSGIFVEQQVARHSQRRLQCGTQQPLDRADARDQDQPRARVGSDQLLNQVQTARLHHRQRLATGRGIARVGMSVRQLWWLPIEHAHLHINIFEGKELFPRKVIGFVKSYWVGKCANESLSNILNVGMSKHGSGAGCHGLS
jgi:hypothetical protein